VKGIKALSDNILTSLERGSFFMCLKNVMSVESTPDLVVTKHIELIH